jgi:hypothetical protein
MANTETKKMSEVIHWSLFLASAATVGLKTLEMAAASSEYVITNSQGIAQYSWLVSGFM